MYQISTEKVTHVFALAVILTMMLVIYGANFIDETFSDTAYTIKQNFTPQTKFYGSLNLPYFD